MAKDFYQALGLTRDADRESVKLAYYDLRRQFAALKRPTRAQNERLVRINAAWDTLKIPNRKTEYDTELTRVAKAKRDRENAAAKKRQQESAAPPPEPEPEQEPEPEPVVDDAPTHNSAWSPTGHQPEAIKGCFADRLEDWDGCWGVLHPCVGRDAAPFKPCSSGC